MNSIEGAGVEETVDDEASSLEASFGTGPGDALAAAALAAGLALSGVACCGEGPTEIWMWSICPHDTPDCSTLQSCDAGGALDASLPDVLDAGRLDHGLQPPMPRPRTDAGDEPPPMPPPRPDAGEEPPPMPPPRPGAGARSHPRCLPLVPARVRSHPRCLHRCHLRRCRPRRHHE